MIEITSSSASLAPRAPGTAYTRADGRASRVLFSLPAPVVAVLVAVLIILVGWADYTTGWELSLFVLYAAPIIIAVWRFGLTAGILSASLSSIVWLFANEATHPYETDLGYIWAMMSRLFYFGVVVFAVLEVRKKQEAAAAHIKMLEEQRQLELDIVSVSEHEQQRIGQDLHDGICQQLAAIGCAARVLAEELESQGNPEASDAAMIEKSLQQAVLEARNLARGIFPVHVDRSGLGAALVDLARIMTRLTGINVTVEGETELSVDSPEASMNLYRIAQEAVANALKHSEANAITIHLRHHNDELELRIEDNGIGLPAKPPARRGMGLRTMRYRAQAIGSSLETGAREGGGTYISCRLNPQLSAL